MHEHACGNNQFPTSPASLQLGPDFSPFSARCIPDDCLAHIIESARLTPLPGDIQPWRWIVVRSDTSKQQIEAALHIRVSLHTAPAILICLADTLTWKSAPLQLQEMVLHQKITEAEARESLRRLRDYYSVSPTAAQRTALANAFVVLHRMASAAAACSVTAWCVTEFDEAAIKTALHIPDRFLVAAVLPLGYSEEAPAPPAAKRSSRAPVYKDKFGEALT